MSFYINQPQLDIGETPVENIFINNFMNMADEVQLKVYLAGLFYARNSRKKHSDIDIAKLLDIDPERVVEAWKFWEELGLVRREAGDVEYISVRDLYLESNFVPKPCGIKDKEDYLILRQESIVKMFERAEEYINSPISSELRVKYIRLMEKYDMTSDMLLMAIEITYVLRNIEKPSFSYVEGILKKWKSGGVDSLKKVRIEEEKFQERQAAYKEVNERLLGKKGFPTKAQIEIIDMYLDLTDDGDFAYKAADYIALHYKTATYSKYKDLYKKLEDAKLLSSEGLTVYEQRYSAQSSGNKRKSRQNFSQDTYKNMTKDDTIKAMKMRNPALNIARRNKDDN